MTTVELPVVEVLDYLSDLIDIDDDNEDIPNEVRDAAYAWITECFKVVRGE